MAQTKKNSASNTKLQAIPALLQDLKSEDYKIRFKTIEKLCKLAEPNTIIPITTIISALNDNQGNIRLFGVRASAAWALGKIADPQAVPALITALSDVAKTVRIRTVDALSNIADPRVVPALLSSLSDKDPEVRRRVIEALGKTADPRAISALVILLNDQEYFRVPAIEALGKIGHPSAIPALVLALNHRDRRIEFLCNEEKEIFITRDTLEKVADLSAIPLLINFLQDTKNNLGGRCDAAYLLGILSSKLPGAPQEEIFQLLTSYLQDKNIHQDLRVAAVQGLSKTINPKKPPVLITTLNDEQAEVRMTAAEALSSISDPQIVPALIASLNYQDRRRVEGYSHDFYSIDVPITRDVLEAKAGLEAIPLLVAFLEDVNNVGRGDAAYLLGRLLYKLPNIPEQQIAQAKAILTLLSKDKHKSIRETAKEALTNIKTK